MQTVYTNDLSPAHAAMLEDSGISPEVAEARGYATITDPTDVRLAPWAPAQRRVPLLLIPSHDVHGHPQPGQIRPDDPREISRNSKAVTLKYESPRGGGSFLDVPPSVRDRLMSTMEPIVLTEGTKKADSAVSAGLLCVSIPGVWNWRGRSVEQNSTAAIAAFDAFPLNGRVVTVVYDSDVTGKDSVRTALRRIVAYLNTFKAEVRIALLPEDGEKVGLDDWLMDGGSVDALDDLARPAEDVLAELDAATASRSTHGRDDRGNALRLYDEMGEEVAWCPSTGWHAWDGMIWSRSADHVVLRRAQVLQDLIRDEVGELIRLGVSPEEVGKHRAHGVRAGAISKVKDAIEWLRPNVVRSWDEYDRDPHLLAVGNGTIELHADGSTTLREADRDDMLTLRTTTVYTPDAPAPFFEATVARFLPDPEIAGYVQRLAGASLIGSNATQTVSIFYGSGANGKSTLLYGLNVALGDDLYVEVDPKSLQENNRSGSAPTPDLMRLLGARLVTAVEASERLDSEMLKRVTGGEKIVARQLHGRTIAFPARFDLILSMNNRPEFQDRSEGLWRRLVVVPFEVRIPDDERLPQDEVQRRLNLEAPGILRWMLDGYAEFRRIGLAIPEKIRAESQTMRDRTDWLRAFVGETFETGLDRSEFVTFPEIWAEFQKYEREDPAVKNPGRNKFYEELRKTYGEDRVGTKAKPGLLGWRKRDDGPSPTSPVSGASSTSALVAEGPREPMTPDPAQNRGNRGTTAVGDSLKGDGFGWLDSMLPPDRPPICGNCGEPMALRPPARLIWECPECRLNA